jgi:nucleoside-diphosphate-sugar epimerase
LSGKYNLGSKAIAVTGAGGYVGSALVEKLVKENLKIIRVSRRKLSPISGMVEDITGEIQHFDTWTDLVQRADIIFHLAGNTSVYEAEHDMLSSSASTVLPVTHLINAARAQGRKPRVIFASTATVYGLAPPEPTKETVEVRPITTYDVHKWLAEKQLMLSARRGDLDCICLRLANVYGPSSSVSSAADRGILNKMVSLALQRKDLTVYGGGSCRRDYVYITDVINAFIAAALRVDVSGQVFNVGTGRGTTIFEAFQKIVQTVETVSKVKVQLKSAPWPADVHPIELRNFVCDTSLISQTLNWTPTVSLESGIASLVHNLIEQNA